ncbi:MAG: hypothetical protein R6U35_07645 [Candidatus Humimicrobiaceae bacterium]
MTRKTIIILFISVFLIITGCSSEQIVNQYLIKDIEIEDVPDINVDERKISDIERIGQEAGSSFEIETDILESEESIKDPFKPFYLNGEDEPENIIRLDAIYSKDEIDYIEVKFNDHVYKLKEEDVFAENFQVQAINENSAVLLKGDEIITLFLNEIYFD